MKNWIFKYEYKDHERRQTVVVDPDTGRIDIAVYVWSETIRPRHRLTRRDVDLAA